MSQNSNLNYIKSVISHLPDFKNLSSIDLSRNSLNTQDLTDCLNSTFKSLKYLTRLDVSNNRLKDNCRNIFEGVENVEYLNLTGCVLTANDLRYFNSDCLFTDKLKGKKNIFFFQ